MNHEMQSELPSAGEIYVSCVCLGVQRAARALARRYDEALRPVGLTSGQFSILSALLRDKAVPLGELASQLGVDRTTLTRNLQSLEKAGLVVSGDADEDRRVREIQLTANGRERVADAMPLWREAQSGSERRLVGGWQTLRTALTQLS